MSVFHQQAQFMAAAGQSGEVELYEKLVNEECVNELLAQALPKFRNAPTLENLVDVLDGICDSVVVLAGLANSLVGADKAYACQEEVFRSNMSKCQYIDGKFVVVKREDGKVLKPANYFKPNLFDILANLPTTDATNGWQHGRI